MEAARARMQEKYDQLAAKELERRRALEEARRLERIEEWRKLQEGKGFYSKRRCAADDDQATADDNATALHSGETTSQKSSRGDKVLRRSDYNPLMGHSSGTCFRPTRRGICLSVVSARSHHFYTSAKKFNFNLSNRSVFGRLLRLGSAIYLPLSALSAHRSRRFLVPANETQITFLSRL